MPIYNARKSITRPAACVAPGGNKSSLCSLHLYSRPTNLTFIFHSPFFIFQPFSHRVVRDLNFVASSRFMSSTTPCAKQLSSALSVASAYACLSGWPAAPGQSAHVSSTASAEDLVLVSERVSSLAHPSKPLTRNPQRASISPQARRRLRLWSPPASSFVFLRPSDPSWCCRQCPKSDPCSSTSSLLRELQDLESCF